jgi:glyoxylase-like metal-dependent hydrolase (beta-lactamase superfamily II)
MHRSPTIARSLLEFLLGVPAPTALAQVDISGEWGTTMFEDILHRGATLVPGDNTGVPLSEAGRRKAESWDEAVVATHERQCIPHPVQYAVRGPGNIRFAKVVDQETGRLIAYSLQGSYVGHFRTIWMDGRPHPSDLAPHSYTGFSTGRWERNTLVVTTTHMKMGYLDRNGMPSSELGRMTEHFIRHGDRLTAVTFIHDPVFLDAPFVRSTDFVLNLTGNAGAWGVCAPDQIVDELLDRPKGYVPHHLPGTVDPGRELFLSSREVPLEAARGGTLTTYPEYSLRLKELAKVGAASPIRRGDEPACGGNRCVPLPNESSGELRVVPVQGRVHMIAGAGGNMAVHVGDDGILLVNSGSGKVTDKVLAAVRELSPKAIRFVLNTAADADNIAGNEVIAKAGSRSTGRGQGAGASVIAHEGVLETLVTAKDRLPALAALPPASWPTMTFAGDLKDIHTNGEAVQMIHQPAAHSGGDSIVFFRGSDVVVTGEIVDVTRYPVIETAQGGTFSGVIDAVNRIIDITVPRDRQEGDTLEIPARGHIADEADLVEYRDMLTIVRDRIEAMIQKGMTLAQVQAAKPTFEYDGLYGSTKGAWTTAMFVEAAYRDLSGPAREQR